jgi:hypothetical protein
MPQRLVIALVFLQRGKQLQDHAFERGHVAGQMLGDGRRHGSGGAIREAHTNETHDRPGLPI